MPNSHIKESVSYKIFRVFNTLFMLGVIVLTLYPFLYVIYASFSVPDLFVASKGLLLAPKGLSLMSYRMVFKDPMIIRGLLNTIVMVLVGLAVSMLLTVIGGYFLSRKDAKLARPMMLMIIFTMYFSGGLIPFYFVVKSLKLVDSMWSMILPTAINTYNLIIMRSAFATIPPDLEDAAKIDGCGHIRKLFQILVPLIMPTIMVVMLYYAVGMWNSWFNASIFLNERTKYPLQLILREILISNDTDKMTSGVNATDSASVAETLKYAVMVVSTVPIIMVYPFVQKFFVKGVMIGAVKG